MSNHRHLMFAAALFVACAPTIVYAETESPEELDQIIVTASRSPLTAANVGASTTVITREQIERRQVRYVTDLLRTVPGFAVKGFVGIFLLICLAAINLLLLGMTSANFRFDTFD